MDEEKEISNLNDFIDMFLYGEDREDLVLDRVFNEIGNMPGCLQEINENTQVELGNIPSGLAIVQWYSRSLPN